MCLSYEARICIQPPAIRLTERIGATRITHRSLGFLSGALYPRHPSAHPLREWSISRSAHDGDEHHLAPTDGAAQGIHATLSQMSFPPPALTHRGATGELQEKPSGRKVPSPRPRREYPCVTDYTEVFVMDVPYEPCNELLDRDLRGATHTLALVFVLERDGASIVVLDPTL